MFESFYNEKLVKKKKEGETNHFQIKPVEICCQQTCTTINAKKVSCGREMIPGENVNL